MGVRIQRPGEPGHPGGNRRTCVRTNHQGRRLTRVFNSTEAAQAYANQIEAHLKLGNIEAVFTPPSQAAGPAPTVADAVACTARWTARTGRATPTASMGTS